MYSYQIKTIVFIAKSFSAIDIQHIMQKQYFDRIPVSMKPSVIMI